MNYEQAVNVAKARGEKPVPEHGRSAYPSLPEAKAG